MSRSEVEDRFDRIIAIGRGDVTRTELDSRLGVERDLFIRLQSEQDKSFNDGLYNLQVKYITKEYLEARLTTFQVVSFVIIGLQATILALVGYALQHSQ